ncbi:TetR/AcrR family transcriptional regulator [Paenibacillus sp. SC116]|uniref:TetR/AcrR family transcriptional regulator n=1 Tax=Paenibacillus sp. SC116 TaxID=2968986 RepID=UPI00215A1E0B|nr:TetR/AcrR family transcriptional regulator [Paenibacillus sp. SC116]MCR8845198.1 TetR/AcrR family transcriptional regulator [Paenibacillus sp. SC116]
MEAKKQSIMEEALALFAEKGYHQTSIQEIADRTGIAKGSVYSFFRSKEELMMTIFEHYHQQIYGALQHILQEPLPSREKLERLIMQSLDQFSRFKLFVSFQRKEVHLQQKKELRELILSYRAKKLYALRQVIAEVYGLEAQPYWLDLATTLNGVIAEFINYVAFDDKLLDYRKVAAYIIQVMDGAAERIMRDTPVPVLNEAMMDDIMRVGRTGFSKHQEQMWEAAAALKQAIEQSSTTAEIIHDEVRQAFSFLESEMLQGRGTSIQARSVTMFLQAQQQTTIKEAAGRLLELLLAERDRSSGG